MANQVFYTPPRSLVPFFTSTAPISLVVGPVGSTKTTAGIIKIAYMAKRVAPCTDGIRRSRCVWVRNTAQQLDDTSIPDFLKWFPDGEAGTFYRTGKRFVLRFDDVECEVLFRGLDDANDVRRLLSLQLTFAVMDEFREIHPDIFEALTGRVGRYPDGMMVPHRPEWGLDSNGFPIRGCVTDDGKPADAVWGMSNPPDMDTYWERLLSNPPKNVHVTFQPSGLSPAADWLQYLKSGYYENLAIGKSQDWIDVYIHAKFGRSLSGEPVFRCFDPDKHVAKESLVPIPNVPLIIGMDAGLNPTATMVQKTYDGRILVYDTITGYETGMGALRFAREKLKPLLMEKYKYMPHTVVIDPSAFHRSQTDERTVADILRSEGLTVIPAKTNSIAARLAAGENVMTRTVNDMPGMLIDPNNKLLIQALRGGYRYKISTKGEKEITPAKDHPASDVADSFTYACLHLDEEMIFGYMRQNTRRNVVPAPVRIV